VQPGGGATASLDGSYAMFGGGFALPETIAAVKAQLALLRDELSPWDAGKEYLNFSERPMDARDLYPEPAYRRLQKVKAQYDPQEVFRANHPITPAR
jgi:Berberine and berberine like